MKIALSQLNPTVGDIEGNSRLIEKEIQAAESKGATLVTFPELALTGYPLQDLLESKRLVDRNRRALEAIAVNVVKTAALVGFVDQNPEKKTGAPYVNAAALLRQGKIEQVFTKELLPTYDVFDERRFFEPRMGPKVFVHEEKKIGVTICEDVWSRDGFLPRIYDQDPLERLKKEKPQLLINLSASPFSVGKPKKRLDLFTQIAKELGVPVAFCNQVGANDSILFDGCSFVMSKAGEFQSAPAFSEALLIVDLNSPSFSEAPWPDTEAEWLHEALVLGIKDYVRKTKNQAVLLGLSGGIDSSVVACLAVQALGKSNVSGISLPSRFTSKDSEEDAAQLAKNLGISFQTFSIESLRSQFSDLWKKSFGSDLGGVSAENIQPRLRMTALMALSNEKKALLLNTSNKSELACGYATLYGDTAGAIAVLGDLKKDQIYSLARHINRKSDVIPSRVLSRAPTAELREGQKDEDTLPPYDVLDRLVEAVIEKKKSREDLLKEGFDPNVLNRFFKLFSSSEYKRFQFPPVLRVSSHAYGIGRRMPLAACRDDSH